MRVLLDVNIIISAVHSAHGIPRRIVEAWRRGLFDVITSDGIITEVREKLQFPRIARKYGLTDDIVNATVQLLERRSLMVVISPTAPVVTGILRTIMFWQSLGLPTRMLWSPEIGDCWR